MTTNRSASPSPLPKDHGYRYPQSDYAHGSLRLGIIVIDGLVLVVAALGAGFIPSLWAGVSWLAFLALYMTEVKRRWGTPGNWLTGTRLVNARGERPSIFQMILRIAGLMLGTLFFIIDLLWMFSNGTRQTIRDKMSGVYVIRRNAQPTGEGKLVYRKVMVAMLTLVFREVEEEA